MTGVTAKAVPAKAAPAKAGPPPSAGSAGIPRWAWFGLPRWTLLISLPVCCSLLIAPLSDPAPGLHSVSGWLAVITASGLFTAVVLTRYRRGTRSDQAAHLLLAGLGMLAVATTVGWSPAWASLFVLLAIGVGIVVVDRTSPVAILAVAAVALVVDLLAGAAADVALTNGVTVLLTGLGNYAVHQLFATVAELRCTRRELAQMAVTQERDRFARDLHDLLGHTLSVIVVKAEAVRRLAPLDSSAAALHAADIEAIGREALTDIRRAAGGYRGAGLERELIRARGALEAAGIILTVTPVPTVDRPLPEEIDVLLGWVVREAVTNVLRHSRSSRCTIGIRGTTRSTRLTIEDTGATFAPRTDPDTGTGLTGLTDRVAAAGGTVEAGPTDHGFRITVDVPNPLGPVTSTRPFAQPRPSPKATPPDPINAVPPTTPSHPTTLSHPTTPSHPTT